MFRDSLNKSERDQFDKAMNAYALSLGRSAFSFDEYAEKWRAFIDRINRGYELTIYDYTNDLSARDILQRFIDSLPANFAQRALEYIQPDDESFRKVTQETRLALIGTESSSEKLAWWWHRLPKNLTGELKEDVSSIPSTIS